MAEARLAQAEQALSTARAQLAQVERGPRPSEVETAAEQVRQAQAQLTQQHAATQRAQQAVVQAQAQWQQLQAELELATTQLRRSQALLERQYISRLEYEQTETQFRVADKRVEAAQEVVASAQADMRAAQAGVQAMQANLRALEATLRTVQAGATPEEIEVARQRVAEAQQALRVARQQVEEEALVRAPFAGIVTAINAEPGQPAATQGVVQLVSDELEIRVDAGRKQFGGPGLGARGHHFVYHLSGRHVSWPGRGDRRCGGPGTRHHHGTHQAVAAAKWLRSGQTVNVDLITHLAVPRMLVPASAVRSSGDQTVVFVVENGGALEKVVLTRPPTSQGVPVLAGLQAQDRVIANAEAITAGSPSGSGRPSTRTRYEAAPLAHLDPSSPAL